MSIPDWSYAADYYGGLMTQGDFEIRTDPVKGKGLFAKRAFATEETVLREKALCCSQNLDEFKQGIPVCEHCLKSLESPADIVQRVAGKQYASSMPRPPVKLPQPTRIPCRNADGYCISLFCSPQCEQRAWEHHHGVVCRAVLKDDAMRALTNFLNENWVQDGVDLSDTHFLALRFVAHAVARHRLQGMPLDAAYAPIAQLIRAPIHKLTFSYLLAEEYEESAAKPPKHETAESARRRRWHHFVEYKQRPLENPIVEHATTKERTKDQMLLSATDIIAQIFQFGKEEVAFFTPARWSELLGAVLLNGQERSPNSNYVEYAAACRAENKATLTAFHRLLRSKKIDVSALDSSSHGQGVYPVGACFNHNCEPNLQVSYVDENNETLLVNALRPIAAGDELCISYIDENDAVEVRQQQLYEHYLFTCGCAKCTRDLAALRA
jgi:hypothetical protein